MVRYIIKRLFIGVVTIWALITITFFLIRIMPGSPFEADNLSQSAIEQLESTYGLDEPMWKQYILYMENPVSYTHLIHLGYLAYDRREQMAYIPNEEIRSEFTDAVKEHQCIIEKYEK